MVDWTAMTYKIQYCAAGFVISFGVQLAEIVGVAEPRNPSSHFAGWVLLQF